MSYNPIDTDILAAALEKAGFVSTKVGKELVYVRPHHKEPALRVKVYTSAAAGKANVKKKGADAIRTCLTFTTDKGKERGVAKAKRVFRTGSDSAIVGRMLQRMRQMYDLANKMAKGERCPKCGAVRYPDSGRCVAWCGWKPPKEKAAPAPKMTQADIDAMEAEQNAAYAKYEAEQETAAFLSDPDFVLYATGEL